MKEIGYYNGKFCHREDPVVSINDRALYFGDGVYEAIYARNNIPFAFDEHMDRFEKSLSFMRISSPMSREEIKAVIQEALSRLDEPEAMIYFQASRGVAPRMHAFPEQAEPSFMLFAQAFHLRDLSPRYSMVTTEDTRWLHCNIKSLNLIANIMAAEKAKEAGCTEAIFHRSGVVTECSSSNIFIVEKGVLRTAPLSNLLLAGITRKHILELAEELHIPIREESFTLEEMMAADEVFFSSTSTHGALISTIDGKPVGGKAEELVRSIQKAYREKLAREAGSIS